ncbi:MAG TPA: hypothetical protein VFI11_12800 [Anaerolineales bacterium]|nr:hypothetical protein [Anaerolineales bacterium]
MVRARLVLIVILSLIAGACGPSAADLQATEDAQASVIAGTQEAIDARATSVQGTQDAADQEATGIAGTATKKAESTQAARETQTERTAVAAQMATKSASSMADLMEQLRGDGYITSAGGSYEALPSFDESWAQLNWYQVYPLEADPADFVLRADASWESASRTANWFASGCGIVFRYKDIDNHYVVFLSLDGYVTMLRSKGGVFGEMGRRYFGEVGTPAGQASIMVTAEAQRFIIFVNGEKVMEREDFGLTEGSLGYTLVSGTNKDFGTRCQLQNVELWRLASN